MSESQAKIHLGMVGIKPGISLEHARNILQTSLLDIVAVCDLNETNLAHARELIGQHIKTYRDYGQMLSDSEKLGLDAMVISTPQYLHRDMTLDAFNAGLHVFCEKPMALTIEECDEMIAASRSAGKLLQIGMHRRYNPLYGEVKRLIDSGEVGKVCIIHGRDLRGDWMVVNYSDRHPSGNWRFSQASSGGTALEKVCHDMDLFNWLTGSCFETVYASGGVDCYIDSGRETVDHFAMNARYQNGIKVNFELSLFTPVHRVHGREYTIIGTEGCLEIDESQFKIYQFYRKSGTSKVIDVDSKRWLAHPGHPASLAQWNAFEECLITNTPSFCDGEKGKEAVRICLAIEESMKTNTLVGRTAEY